MGRVPGFFKFSGVKEREKLEGDFLLPSFRHKISMTFSIR
jgi:hypothetical protein